MKFQNWWSKMSQFLSLGTLLFAAYSLYSLLWQQREYHQKLQADRYFPTLNLAGWGVKEDFRIPKDFPPEFRISEHTFWPFLRDGRIEGWWVEDSGIGDRFYYEDNLLIDEKGEAHVKTL